jgi:hypothetical protein
LGTFATAGSAENEECLIGTGKRRTHAKNEGRAETGPNGMGSLLSLVVAEKNWNFTPGRAMGSS